MVKSENFFKTSGLHYHWKKLDVATKLRLDIFGGLGVVMEVIYREIFSILKVQTIMWLCSPGVLGLSKYYITIEALTYVSGSKIHIGVSSRERFEKNLNFSV